MKNIKYFSENFPILVVNNSIFLNRHVYVMSISGMVAFMKTCHIYPKYWNSLTPYHIYNKIENVHFSTL